MPRVTLLSPSSTISRTFAGEASVKMDGMYVFRSAPAQNASPAPVRDRDVEVVVVPEVRPGFDHRPVDVGVDRISRLRSVDRQVGDPTALLVLQLCHLASSSVVSRTRP